MSGPVRQKLNEMENLAWIFWLVLGIVLIIAEIFTLGFVLFWFGLGAIAAAIVGFVGFGIFWQFMVFAGVSMALTVMSRTIFANYMWGSGSNEIKTGADALPGMIGTVTSASKGSLRETAVKVYGSEWTAFPEDGEAIFSEGDKVEVVRITGSTVYVRSAQRELPGWKQED